MEPVRDIAESAGSTDPDVGLRAVAAPIRGAVGVGTAAINVSAHASRVSMVAMRGKILPALLETAHQIEDDLKAQSSP